MPSVRGRELKPRYLNDLLESEMMPSVRGRELKRRDVGQLPGRRGCPPAGARIETVQAYWPHLPCRMPSVRDKSKPHSAHPTLAGPSMPPLLEWQLKLLCGLVLYGWISFRYGLYHITPLDRWHAFRDAKCARQTFMCDGAPAAGRMEAWRRIEHLMRFSRT